VDDKAVAVRPLAVVHEGIRTIKTVRMHATNALDVRAHHFTAMVSHAGASHDALTFAMGGKWTLIQARRLFPQTLVRQVRARAAANLNSTGLVVSAPLYATDQGP